MAANEKKFLTKVTPYDVDGTEGKVRFVLGNGQEVTLDLAKVPSDTVNRLTIHGASQKVGDSVAGLSKEKKYGEAFATLVDMVAMLESGEWTSAREGGTSDLVLALAKLKKLPVEDVRVAVGRMDEEQRKNALANLAVKKTIADIKAARLAEAAKAEKASVDDIELNLD